MRGAHHSAVRTAAIVGAAVLGISAVVMTTATAKDKFKPDTDEVTNTVVTGTPVLTADPDPNNPAANAVDIPLSSTTFTQKAGEVVVISAAMDEATLNRTTPPDQFCDLFVAVEGTGAHDAWNFGLYDIFSTARRGDGGDRIDDAVLPAPTTDQTYTLAARAQEVDFEPGFTEPGDTGDCTDDEFTVSVTISFTTLRD